MSNKTNNLGLTKPTPEDFYDVDVQNQNMDIIDEAFGNQNQEFSAKYNNHVKNEQNPHKVTAEQVGAIPLDGSKATTAARLPLFNDFCLIYADNQQINLQTRNEAGNDNNRRILRVYNSGQFANIKDALRFVDVINGTLTAYLIYGEHNKPTAEDVGAIPLDGSKAMTGTTLELNNGHGYIFNNIYQTRIQSRTESGSDDNSRALQVRNSAYPNDTLKGAVRLVDTTDGGTTTYNLYGEHNRPYSYGTTDLTPGQSPLATGELYFVYE